MCSLLLALVFAAVAPSAAPEVTATRIDGTAIAGALRAWDADQVTVATAEGDVHLPTDQLLSVQWNPAPSPSKATPNSASGEVELVDGSLIPIVEFTSAAATATIAVNAPLVSEHKSRTLARKQLAAVRLQPLSPAAAAQWQEIRNNDLASDVLVLLKRRGTSLDYVEGVLGDITPEKIEFTLDGESKRIERAKVAGIIYYRRDQPTPAEPACIVQGRSGLRASLLRADLAGDLLRLTTVAGVELQWPLDDVRLADFSAGKLRYLSDIEPLSERWTPLVGLPAGATLAAEYGRARRDQSAYGGPLALRRGSDVATAPIGQTRSYPKGLALRSRTELVYRVPAGFSRFNSIAGIDPASMASGHVRLEIYGDDRLLMEDEIAGHEAPRPIDVDIAGVKRLKFVVDYGRNLDTGDWLNLCGARIIK